MLSFHSIFASEPANNSIVVALDTPILTVNPLQAGDAPSQRVGNLVHCALVKRTKDLKMIPDFATKIKEPTPGHLIFTLRENGFFQDETFISPQHVLSSIKNYLENSIYKIQLEIIKKYHVEKNLLHIFYDHRKNPFFINNLFLVKIHKEEGGKFIGCGEFSLKENKLNSTRISRFSKYYNYRNDKKYFQNYEFLFLKDDITRYLKFKIGEINVLPSSLGLSKSTILKNQKKLDHSFLEMRGTDLQYLAFNTKNEILKKKNVRKALAMAFSREELSETLLNGYTDVTQTILNPLVMGYSNLPALPFNPNAAEKILDAEGFVKNKKGIRFTLTFKVTPFKESIDVAKFFADSMKKIGVQIEILVLDPARFLFDVNKASFDVITSRWTGVTEPTMLERVYHSKEPPRWNRSGYNNPEVDALLEKARTNNQYYQEVQKLVLEDLPLVPLWHWRQTVIYKSYIKGLEVYPNGDYLELAGAYKD